MKLLLALFLVTLVTGQLLPARTGTCGPTNKITYSETVLPSDLVDDYQVYFVSSNNQIVFIRTTDGHVYRSENEGQTWEKQTVPEKMKNIDPLKLVTNIFHTQVQDQSITLFFISENLLWISEDTGRTYRLIDDMPGGTFQLYPNAFYKGLFIARRTLGDTHELWLGDIQTTVKWNRLVGNVPSHAPVSWSSFAKTSPNRIYTLLYKPGHTSPYQTQLVYTDNWFNTTTVLSPTNVFTWYHMEPDKFVALSCIETAACTTKAMFISEDGGATFHNPSFPDYRKDTLTEGNFHVFEVTDDAIWARVERSCVSTELCWGDVFHSDSADKDFTLSLPYQHYWDFTKYESVDGIYVANQYITNGGIPEAGDGVRSLITFNKGSQWSLMRSPSLDSKGQPYKDASGNLCTIERGCSLHVHGWTSPGGLFSYFYSTPNAIGLMIASGNVGDRLEEKGTDIRLFVSSSAGTNWTEVREGQWVPEIGDHGSIITLVNGRDETNEVIYSIGDPEEKSTWNSCKFAADSEKIFARNIRVSEGWDSTRFILYGQKRNATTGSRNAVLIHLNFDNEFSGKCMDSDFEPFTPKSLHGNCVMGRSTTYQRRAKGKTCYFGEAHEKKTESTSCECQTEDYECDHCFFRPDLSSDCQLECIVPNIPPAPASCANATPDTFYSVESFGYRLIANNSCDPSRPGAEKPKSKIPCQFTPRSTSSGRIIPPSYDTPSNNSWVVVVVALLVLLAGAGVVAYLWKYNTSFYNCVRYTLGVDDNRAATTSYQKVGEEQEVLTEQNEEEDSLDA